MMKDTHNSRTEFIVTPSTPLNGVVPQPNTQQQSSNIQSNVQQQQSSNIQSNVQQQQSSNTQQQPSVVTDVSATVKAILLGTRVKTLYKYAHLFDQVSFEKLCENPNTSLNLIIDIIQLDNVEPADKGSLCLRSAILTARYDIADILLKDGRVKRPSKWKSHILSHELGDSFENWITQWCLHEERWPMLPLLFEHQMFQLSDEQMYTHILLGYKNDNLLLKFLADIDIQNNNLNINKLFYINLLEALKQCKVDIALIALYAERYDSTIALIEDILNK